MPIVARLRPLVFPLLRSPSSSTAALYLVVSALANVLRVWTGSLSEYRFPHPLIATSLHLALALFVLLLASLTSRLLIRTPLPRRSYALLSTFATASSLSSLPFSIKRGISPHTLSAPLLSVLSSLLYLRLAHTAETPFLSFTRLLPICVAAVLPSSTGGGRGAAVLTALVLLGGKGVSIAAPNGAVLCAGGWSVGVLAWVKEIKAGEAEREKSASSAEENEGALGDGKSEKRALATPQVLSRRFSPSTTLLSQLLSHLLLSLPLLLLTALLSPEPTNISRSHHWGFFTSPGFWAQETGMALCELSNLAVFFSAVQHLSTPIVFALSAISHLYVQPLLFHHLFGNPLDLSPILGGEGALGMPTQGTLLLLIAAWALSGVGDGEAEGGRRKEG